MSWSTNDFTVVAAVNNRETLAKCLMRSPDISGGNLRVKTYENYSSASLALNDGLVECSAPIVIFVHQDVYLPKLWLSKLIDQIDLVEQTSSRWSVLGVSGRENSGALVGRVWDTGLGREIGKGGFSPTEVVTLDELLLVLRRDSKLKFDTGLPGFHLYGADLVMQGRLRGMPAFAVDAPVVHNSKPVSLAAMNGPYSDAYRYMQRKWRKLLPIPNLVCDITNSPFALWRAKWRRMRTLMKGVNRPPLDAVAIARSLNYEMADEAEQTATRAYGNSSGLSAI